MIASAHDPAEPPRNGRSEVPLAGGVANPGAVVRVGDTVRRPAKRQTATVHAFLRHLDGNGLQGAVPAPFGFDDQGREVLGYLEGRIYLSPREAWLAGEELLLSVARLQRRLHHAAAGFAVPSDAVWDDDVGEGYFPDGIEGDVVCHNDLCVENVVTRDGRAVGFIDFDYARPVDPLFDIAVAVRHWAPVRAAEDLDGLSGGLDVSERFRRFVDVHELDRARRARVVSIVERFLDRAHSNVQRLASEGGQGFAAMIADGYLEQNRRSVTWLRAHARELTR